MFAALAVSIAFWPSPAEAQPPHHHPAPSQPAYVPPPSDADRAAARGYDVEASLRGLLGGLTGRRGEDLERFIDRGRRLGEVEHLVNPVSDAESKFARTGRQGGDQRKLRPAELRALELIADGMTTVEAAAHLQVEHETVKTQMKAARWRLGAKTAAQAVRLAIRTGQLAA